MGLWDTAKGDVTLDGYPIGQKTPAKITGQAGGATASPCPLAGNIVAQAVSAGVQPGGTAADSVLAVFSIPASFFDQSGRSLEIQASGSFGATANAKRVKIIVGCTTAVVGSAVTGGTTVADTGSVTTNGGGWNIQAELIKTGAAGSNTQLALHQQAQVGAAVSALLAPQALTLTESGSVLCAITGNAATATTDITFNAVQAFAQN